MDSKEDVDYTDRIILAVAMYVAILIFTLLMMKCVLVVMKIWKKKEWKDIGTVENRNNDREGAVEEVNIDTALLLQ
jgi:hypothetical protein